MTSRTFSRIAVALPLVALWLAGDLVTPLLARRGLEPGRVGRVGDPGGIRGGVRDVNVGVGRVDRDVHVHGRRPVGYHGRAQFWDEVDDERDQRVVGALVGALVVGTLVNRPPKNAQPTMVGNQQYYYSDGNYYQPSGNQYQIVSPPLGVEVNNIPAGAQKFNVGDATYFSANGVYYRVYYRGADPVFQVVNNPLG